MAAVIVTLAGCAGHAPAPRALQTTRSELLTYVDEIEPIRLGVNRLLDGADPILSGFRSHRISPGQAAREMGGLEQRFAAYTVDVTAIDPPEPQLHALHVEYAHTYILEDSYLSSLTVALSEKELDNLPNTQSEQRAAIIEWRTGLTVLARKVGLSLPLDLQQAGRGEIAPSPGGS